MRVSFEVGLESAVICSVQERAFPGAELNELWLWSEFVQAVVGCYSALFPDTCTVSWCRNVSCPRDILDDQRGRLLCDHNIAGALNCLLFRYINLM